MTLTPLDLPFTFCPRLHTFIPHSVKHHTGMLKTGLILITHYTL
jgi:hypothetical protein